MKKIKIHFVCRGNFYRSRMAELYAKSLNLPNVDFSSSGIESTKYYPHRISVSVLVEYIAKTKGFNLETTPMTTQTTSEMLDKQDLIIFMNEDVQRQALAEFGVSELKTQTWRIHDIDKINGIHQASDMSKKLQHSTAEATFKKIKKHVDELVIEATQTSWLDIFDENNKPYGFSLPIAWAHENKNAWHRGIHAFITTPKGYVVEKRSKDIIFSPELLDISLGGSVDAGEEPLDAVTRETKEELGLTIPKTHFELLELRKVVSYHPHYDNYSRIFLYSYHAHIDQSDPQFHVQASEVSEAAIISFRKTKSLVRMHRLNNFGRLNYSYAYYNRILKLIDSRKQRV